MFRHGSDLYLVARTDPGGPFWSHDNPLLNTLPPWEHHLVDLVNFSFRQHGTAIWRLDQATGTLEKLLELLSKGLVSSDSRQQLEEVKEAGALCMKKPSTILKDTGEKVEVVKEAAEKKEETKSRKTPSPAVSHVRLKPPDFSSKMTLFRTGEKHQEEVKVLI